MTSLNALAVYCFSVCVPQPGANDFDTRAAALVSALDVYLDEFGVVSWEQTSYLPPTISRERGTWQWIERSRRSICGPDLVFFDLTTWTRDPSNNSRHERREVELSAGTWRIGCELSGSSKGVLVAPRDFHTWGANMARWIGYYSEYSQGRMSRTLGDLFDNAEAVTYLEPTSDEPWPGVSARGLMFGEGVDCSVRLDPAYGMAPRVMRFTEAASGRVVEEFRVAEYQRVGQSEIFAPHVGVYVMRSRHVPESPSQAPPIADNHVRDLELTVSLDGLPSSVRGIPGITSIVQDLVTINRLDDGESWEGPIGWFDAESEMTSPIVVVFDSVVCGEGWRGIQEFRMSVDPGKQFLDGTGETVTRDSALDLWLERSGVQERIK